MANLKENLNNGSKTVTMTSSDIDFLQQWRTFMQEQLDGLLERGAGIYLNYLAVNKFDMPAGRTYHFEFHPDREYENLTITEKQ